MAPRDDATREVTRAALVGRARDLIPLLRERAAGAEAVRCIPDETHQAFVEAGFYRLFQPARYGGFEMDFAMMVDIGAELGRGCGSSAWVVTNLAEHAWVGGMAHPAAQDELWADSPETLIASSFPAPDASVTQVEGGLVVDGTWKYSSGVDFAAWNLLQTFHRPEDAPPEHRFALVPRSDYEIVDDWFVTGLAATASKSIVVKDVFVPDHRTLSSFDVQGGASPGSAVSDSPLYKLPYWAIAAKVFSGPAVGIARGALDLIEDDIEARVSVGGAKLSDQPTVHARLAESGAEIEAARALLLKDCAEATIFTETGRRAELLQRAIWRRNNAYAALLCVRSVERLFGLAGMRGMVPDNHVQRAWRDVHAAAAQLGQAWDPAAGNYGRARFGLPFTDPRA